MGLELAGQRPARMSIANVATGESVDAQFNPADFEEALEVNWARQTVPGLSHQPLQFVNTGNANAGTGEPGLAHARETCVDLARLAGIEPEQVLPCSTGVMLEPLLIDRLKAGLPAALERRSAAH